MFGQEWSGAVTFGFLVALVLAIWSVVHILQSRSGPLGKALWSVFVLFVPYAGFLVWLLVGPRSERQRLT